jgi:site-specific recombinase XerD
MKANNQPRRQQTLENVGDCLYRSSLTEVYYGIFERDGRQVKRSLRTSDRELAKRRLEELRRKVERLSASDSKTLPFAEYKPNEKAGAKNDELIGGLAKRWIDAVGGGMELSSRDRQLGVIRNLGRHLRGLSIRGITLRSLEQWAKTRRESCSARTFNYELETLRRILDYGVKHGLLLENPARDITRRKPHKKAIIIPTKAKFTAMLTTMRQNHGNDSADLAELLAYSGCRKSEIVGDAKYSKPPLFWRDVNFELKVFTITCSKNHEPRTVPLFPSLESFLRELQARRPIQPKPDERIIKIDSAKQAIATAATKAGLPKFGHHTCRHFFCSNAIEAGADFKVIAGWLGHKDGGVLVARTYGHLRNEHSASMAKRMTWGATDEPPANVTLTTTVANG